MAKLFLIRHGQASFHSANYDQLSELGQHQCQHLGQHFRDEKEVGRCIRGSLHRHQQSFDAFNQFASLDQDCIVDEGFNEYDHLGVFHKAYPEFDDPMKFQTWLKQQSNPKKMFQEMFEQSVAKWVKGELQGIESWQAFKTRVIDAYQRAKESTATASSTLIFTSGGPITIISQMLLGLSDRAALDLNWGLVNAGVTQVWFNQHKESLATLNEHQHLTHLKNGISFR